MGVPNLSFNIYVWAAVSFTSYSVLAELIIVVGSLQTCNLSHCPSIKWIYWKINELVNDWLILRLYLIKFLLWFFKEIKCIVWKWINNWVIDISLNERLWFLFPNSVDLCDINIKICVVVIELISMMTDVILV